MKNKKIIISSFLIFISFFVGYILGKEVMKTELEKNNEILNMK